MTENKTQLFNWIGILSLFTKPKHKFVSRKDMESEDADQFLICEFKG